nr:hypothetical protein [Mesorhizobium sp.]
MLPDRSAIAGGYLAEVQRLIARDCICGTGFLGRCRRDRGRHVVARDWRDPTVSCGQREFSRRPAWLKPVLENEVAVEPASKDRRRHAAARQPSFGIAVDGREIER